MNIPSLHIGRGDYQHGVTLFPIWHASVASENIQSGTENTVLITELEDPVVERLQVRSITDRPVLLLDGDILVGGKQDRMLVGSTLLAPGRTQQVEVRCVEQQRWNDGHRHTAGTRRSSSYVRGERDQGEVWRRVHRESQNRSAPTTPASFQMLPGQSGVLIGISGRPVLLEVFGSHELLASYWKLILESAVTEAAGRPAAVTTGHTARSFIRKVDKLSLPSETGRDAEASVNTRDGMLEFRGMFHEGRLLQASIINQEAVSV